MLANLRNLTRLRASILLRHSAASAQLDLKGGFQKLTMLELRGPASHLVRFMLASSMPRLNHLCLVVSSHPEAIHISLASICQHIGPHTLTRFRAKLRSFRRPSPFLIDLLEPLIPFTNLEELEFLLEERLPLRDVDFERFARAWPKLRALVISQSNNTLSDPNRVPGSFERPTLRGLVDFARSCPRLARLCILDLDTTTVPRVDSVPLLGHSLLNLCILNLVGAEDKEKQLDIAVVLDRLFPNLKLTTGISALPRYGENPNPFLEDSDNIARLLRAMQIARTHCPSGV